MYLGVKEHTEAQVSDYSNFLDGFLMQEDTFGTMVAADIAAMNKAQKSTSMSKTTKAVIGVVLGVVVLGGGFLAYKKLKK